jgi:TLD
MSGESFLWRMNEKRPLLKEKDQNNEDLLNDIARKEGDIDVYRWTGINDECQLFSWDRLAAGSGMMISGDGFGLIVQDDLSRGSSSPCATYDNPCLVSSKTGRFEVANLEVWAMTPFLFCSEAEDTDAALRFIEGNMMNAKGDFKNTHAQSAWTNFL